MIEHKNNYSVVQELGSLVFVIFCAVVGGTFFGIINGFKLPNIKPFNGYEVKPLLRCIQIPPIIAMIFAGCISRNFFGKIVAPYNPEFAQWLRTCCLAILLTKGGLQVSFRGKGLIVVFLAMIPQLCEAVTLALLGTALFKFPIDVSFTFGFTISTVAAAIVVPQLMKWNELGYGRSKGISSSLIAACTFDNI